MHIRSFLTSTFLPTNTSNISNIGNTAQLSTRQPIDKMPYERVAVLMLSWLDELDDVYTGDEMDVLSDVFQGLYHYTVVRRPLTIGPSIMLQTSDHVKKFIQTFDKGNTLLIVYYGGHGGAKSTGEMFLSRYVLPHIP